MLIIYFVISIFPSWEQKSKSFGSRSDPNLKESQTFLTESAPSQHSEHTEQPSLRSQCHPRCESERPALKVSELLRQRQIVREAAKRRILAEPFTVYKTKKMSRKEARASQANGIKEFVPLQAPPDPFPSAVPSNRPDYQRERLLRTQRDRALLGLQKAQRFCAQCDLQNLQNLQNLQKQTTSEKSLSPVRKATTFQYFSF